MFPNYLAISDSPRHFLKLRFYAFPRSFIINNEMARKVLNILCALMFTKELWKCKFWYYSSVLISYGNLLYFLLLFFSDSWKVLTYSSTDFLQMTNFMKIGIIFHTFSCWCQNIKPIYYSSRTHALKDF